MSDYAVRKTVTLKFYHKNIPEDFNFFQISNDMMKSHKILRTNRIHNMPNKIHKKEFELNDVVISEELKPERYEIYNSVEQNIDPDTRNEDVVDDKTFLSILDHLEKAVQDIELEGDAREIFDIKMRKIYESGLKLKNQNVKHNNDITFDKLTPAERQEVRNYLQHRVNSHNGYNHMQERRHWPRDGKINTVEEKDINVMDDYYPEQKEVESEEVVYTGIDDKLIEILNNKKHIKNNKYEYYDRNYGTDEEHYTDRFDEIEDNTLPPPRKQENINRYEKNLKQQNSIQENIAHKKHTKVDHAHSKMEVIKKLNEELRLRHHGGSKQNKHLYDHTAKAAIRPTHHKNMKKKTRKLHKPPAYRRVIEVS